MRDNKKHYIEDDHIEDLFSEHLNYYLRWGMTWLFVLGLLFGVISLVVKWPEVIDAPAVLTSNVRPKEIRIKQDAKVEQILFANGDSVLEGEIIAILENSTDYKELARLRDMIEQLDAILNTDGFTHLSMAIDNHKFSNLGNVQMAFESFYHDYTEYQLAASDHYHSKKLLLLDNRAANARKNLKNLLEQEATLLNDYEISVKLYTNEKRLYEGQNIPEYELLEYESTMLRKKLAYQSAKLAVIQNEATLQIIEAEKIDLQHRIESQRIALIESINNLSSVIKQWESLYLLKSPIAGVLSIPVVIEENAPVSRDMPGFYVIPVNSDPVVHISISQFNMSAIDTGKTVRIKLNAYPHDEFGLLEGKISHISMIPRDGNYDAIVKLNNGLTTTFNKKIAFINGIEGEATIIAENKILAAQVFKSFMQ